MNHLNNFWFNALPENVSLTDISVLVFDKDKTITPPNKPITPQMADILATLSRKKVIIILTARDFNTCKEHILSLIERYNPNFKNILFGCSNGSELYYHEGDWRQFEDVFMSKQKLEIKAHYSEILRMANEFFQREDFILEERSPTMAALFPPKTMSDDERENFDPNADKRNKFIELLRAWEVFPKNYEIIAGGSTSIDIGLHNKETGMRNAIKYLQNVRREFGEIIFFGDGFPWNDSPVLNVEWINIVQVENESVTEEILKNFLKNNS